jgi:hypothetical protein
MDRLEFVPPYMDEVQCRTCCHIYKP